MGKLQLQSAHTPESQSVEGFNPQVLLHGEVEAPDHADGVLMHPGDLEGSFPGVLDRKPFLYVAAAGDTDGEDGDLDGRVTMTITS